MVFKLNYIVPKYLTKINFKRKNDSIFTTIIFNNKKDKRIDAKHIQEIISKGIKRIFVPEDSLYGRILARDIINSNTGEIIADANQEITENILNTLRIANIQNFQLR